MRVPSGPESDPHGPWVLSPVIVSLLTYGLLLRLLSLHFGCTLRFPVGPRPTPFEQVASSMGETMTVIHACFALLLGFELHEALRRPRRPGRALAAVLALLCVWILQRLVADFPEMWARVTGG